MYIEIIKNRESPPAILLRESYRENGVVKKRTVANLTKWPEKRIEDMKASLAGKTFKQQTQMNDFHESQSGPVYGVLSVLKKLADEIGLTTIFS